MRFVLQKWVLHNRGVTLLVLLQVCSSKHTYFYTIALLHQASKDRGTGYKLRYLMQELERRARSMGRDTCHITLAMCGAAAYPTIYQCKLRLL